MLKIFKDHSSKQCILDDFDFYEERQKRIQEKKVKQQQFQKQVGDISSSIFFPFLLAVFIIFMVFLIILLR